MAKLRELTEKDVEIILECEPEDMPYVGNCSAIDPVQDKKTENWIRKQLANGNEWAWCMVTVRARWNELEGADYLGGCSYRSEEDFRTPGGYFDDMKALAIDDLNAQLERMAHKLESLSS